MESRSSACRATSPRGGAVMLKQELQMFSKISLGVAKMPGSKHRKAKQGRPHGFGHVEWRG